LSESTWKILAVVLLAGLVLTSYGAIYFYQEVSTLQSDNSYLKSRLGSVSETVDIGVNFGNGTTLWYNDTYVPVGASVYNATYAATGGRVTTESFTLGNVTEAFVTGVLGVQSTSTSYWIWYYFDSASSSWTEATVGAGEFLGVQGGVYLWNFTSGG
jgi:hypothetical protein